jgi:hypothetical protein
MAWLYGPMAAGALSVCIAFMMVLVGFTKIAILPE